MPAAARNAAQHDHPEQHDDASPTPNTYGGRVPLQPELRPALHEELVEGLKRRLRAELRRRKSGWTRVQLRVALAVLQSIDFKNGVCTVAMERLRKLARCQRSGFFEAMAWLEGRGVIEERDSYYADFSACTHTIVRGWDGFKACTQMRQQARREGRPFGCPAHHGRVVIRWALNTVADLDAALKKEPPRPIRRQASRGPLGRTANGPRARRVSEGTNGPRTLDPGSLSQDDPFSSSPGRVSRETERIDPPDVGLEGRGPSAPSPASPNDRPNGAERPAPTSPPHAPSASGFAPGGVGRNPESTDGGGARAVPPAPPTAAVSAVLAAQREHVLRTTLSASPASPYERELVRAVLATWTVAELVAALRSIGRTVREEPKKFGYRGRITWLFSGQVSQGERDQRIQYALDAESERAAAAAARERRSSAPPASAGPRPAKAAPSRAVDANVADMQELSLAALKRAGETGRPLPEIWQELLSEFVAAPPEDAS